MTLNLSIPDIADQLDSSVERRGVYVEEWIEALPYANPGVLVNKLLEAIFRLNRNPIKPAQRLLLMEHYARPYQYLLEMQEKHGISRTVSAFEKHRAESDAARQVALEMANGYKIVLVHSMSKRKMFGNNKDATVATQRAMLFLSFSLLHSYDEYLPTPSNLWSEMWALYNYAVRCGVDNEALSANDFRADFRTTISQVYKRILLTSLVDPYHLREGEIWRVFAVVNEWAGQAMLGEMRSVDKPAGVFLVDATTDQRPFGYAAGGRRLSEHCMILDATAVIDALQRKLKEDNPTREQRQQLGRVLRSLGLPPKRHSPRETSDGRVRLTSGLSSLHHFTESNSTGSTASSGGTADEDDDAGIEIGDATGEMAMGGPSYQTERWEIVDKGPGGVGVLRNKRPAVPVSVGELIGLAFDDPNQDGVGWSIGVVRWLTVAELGEYHAGIQLLSRAAQPVRFRGAGDDSNGQNTTGLALPRLGADKSSTLIAPKGWYEKGASLTVERERSSITVTMAALVESAGSYDRFTYSLQ